MPKRSKIEKEKRIVEHMIRIYCRHKEGNAELCDECLELIRYSHSRLDRCPDSNNKSSCKRCTHHCYKPAMAARIRSVMRYSGPRMFFIAPIASLKHL